MTSPHSRGPLQTALLFLALVAGLVVASFFVVRAFQAADDISGDAVLVIERTPDVPAAFVLNIARTQAEAPALAELLDRAWVGGKATGKDPEAVRAARAYLDVIAMENGGTTFAEAPFEDTLRWGEGDEARTFRLLFFGE